MTFDQFITKWNGNGLDVDNFPVGQPNQCFDVFIQYNREVIGLQDYIQCKSSGFVKDIWNDFDNTVLPQFYDKIDRYAKGEKGDVAIWGNCPIAPYSHITLLIEDKGTIQRVFGQNQPESYCTTKELSSTGLLGYLRPKNGNATREQVITDYLDILERNPAGVDEAGISHYMNYANDVVRADLMGSIERATLLANKAAAEQARLAQAEIDRVAADKKAKVLTIPAEQTKAGFKKYNVMISDKITEPPIDG